MKIAAILALRSVEGHLPERKDGVVLGLLLCLTLGFLLLNAIYRSTELDEGYSLLLLSGHPRVEWPLGTFTKAEVAAWFQTASMIDIPSNLRDYDVHPPLWFYVQAGWHSIVGTDLSRSRLLPVLFTLLNFGLVAAVAQQCRAPAALACAIAFTSYAILYTGSTIRMYPMALTFLLLGTWLLLDAVQRVRHTAAQSRRPADGEVLIRIALAGACFGLGMVSHLLILFPCVAICAVTVSSLLSRRRFAAIVMLALAPLPFLIWAGTYFVVQDRRNGQFPPFDLLTTTFQIAQHYAGAMLGATPLLAVGVWQTVIAGMLAVSLIAAILAAATGALGMLGRTEGRVVIVGALMMPATMFLLGVVFDREVSQPRYMLYSVPFLAIFLARGLRETTLLPRRLTVAIITLLIGLQCVSAATLPWARATQQAAGPTIRDIAQVWQEGSILLLPEAEDTTGMTITFLLESKADWPLHYVLGDEPAGRLLSNVEGRPRVFLVILGDDFGKRAIEHARAVLEANGWRNTGERLPPIIARTARRAWEEYRRDQMPVREHVMD